MTEQRKHPLRVAEEKLRDLGIEHAPVQGFTESNDVDGRYVVLSDPPGVYYILGGVDNLNRPHMAEKGGVIQLLFLDCPENAQQLADELGWRLLNVEQLPIHPDAQIRVMSATLGAPFAFKFEVTNEVWETPRFEIPLGNA